MGSRRLRRGSAWILHPHRELNSLADQRLDYDVQHASTFRPTFLRSSTSGRSRIVRTVLLTLLQRLELMRIWVCRTRSFDQDADRTAQAPWEGVRQRQARFVRSLSAFLRHGRADPESATLRSIRRKVPRRTSAALARSPRSRAHIDENAGYQRQLASLYHRRSWIDARMAERGRQRGAGSASARLRPSLRRTETLVLSARIQILRS